MPEAILKLGDPALVDQVRPSCCQCGVQQPLHTVLLHQPLLIGRQPELSSVIHRSTEGLRDSAQLGHTSLWQSLHRGTSVLPYPF